MIHRVFALAVLAAAFTMVGCGGGSTSAHSVLVAKLDGSAEVPKGPPTGSGTARITLNRKTGKACWALALQGISKPLSAHIQQGSDSQSGPVVIPLGSVYVRRGCVSVPDKSLAAVASHPGSYYVNVHTRKYLNGAIRGQLHSA